MEDKGSMMLRFRGSDYKISLGLTRYDRMDRLLMTLGFTKSKADSNLCFKVEGRRPVMLLLCVDALFSMHGGVAECGWNLPQTLEEISTQNGPFKFYSNSMSSCVSQ